MIGMLISLSYLVVCHDMMGGLMLRMISMLISLSYLAVCHNMMGGYAENDRYVNFFILFSGVS